MMKKVFMTLVAAVMAVGASAQVFVGGGVGIGSADNGGSDNITAYKFVPEVGYSFNSDWAVGATFGWKGSNHGGAKSVEFNPYVRYTFFHSRLVNAFVDGTVGYAHEYGANNRDIDRLQIGFKPGVALNLTPCLSFVTKVGFVGYDHSKDNNSKAKVDEWGVNVDGNNITFGLYYNF